MRYVLWVVAALFIGSSCQSEEGKTKESLERAVRQTIEDKAFKNGQRVNLLEISSLTYEMKDSNVIDLTRYLTLNEQIAEVEAQSEKLAPLVREKTKAYAEESNPVVKEMLRKEALSMAKRDEISIKLT